MPSLFLFLFFPPHLAVVIDDDRCDQRDHDDAVHAQYHGQYLPYRGGGGDVAEADGGHDGEAVPQPVLQAIHVGLQEPENIGEGEDQQHQAAYDLRGVGLPRHIGQRSQIDTGK